VWGSNSAWNVKNYKTAIFLGRDKDAASTGRKSKGERPPIQPRRHPSMR